jgi:hypothetical protein
MSSSKKNGQVNFFRWRHFAMPSMILPSATLSATHFPSFFFNSSFFIRKIFRFYFCFFRNIPFACQPERLEPLLTVVTEGNSKSTNERGPSLVGLLGLSCLYKWFLYCLGCPSRPVQNNVFLTVYYFNACDPDRPASRAGSRAGSPDS